MRVILQLLLFSTVIPLVAGLIRRSKLNTFFNLLLLSLVSSVLSEIFGYLSAEYFRNNIAVYSTYALINIPIIAKMWQSHHYNTYQDKQIISVTAILFVFLTAISIPVYGLTMETHYIVLSLNLLSSFLFALHHIYKEITSEYDASHSLHNPYLIVSGAYFVYVLATITIVLADSISHSKWTDHFRMFFFLIQNLILTYAFYIYDKQSSNQ